MFTTKSGEFCLYQTLNYESGYVVVNAGGLIARCSVVAGLIRRSRSIIYEVGQWWRMANHELLQWLSCLMNGSKEHSHLIFMAYVENERFES